MTSRRDQWWSAARRQPDEPLPQEVTATTGVRAPSDRRKSNGSSGRVHEPLLPTVRNASRRCYAARSGQVGRFVGRLLAAGGRGLAVNGQGKAEARGGLAGLARLEGVV